jgi:hypothetical protein
MQPDSCNIAATDDEALQRFNASLDETAEHNRRVLAQLKPHELAQLEAWLRTRKRSTPPARPRVTATSAPRPGGRSPRAPGQLVVAELGTGPGRRLRP